MEPELCLEVRYLEWTDEGLLRHPSFLGLREDATLSEIKDAHRRLITRVHPDAGGSAELANRVNVARDTLIAEMNRRKPRAS